MPKPLESIQHSSESIWGRDVLLEQGKKIMLNASSGKGKSTFTNTIFGLRKDFTGQLLYDSRDTKSFSPEEWIIIRRDKISVVFQDLQLFNNLTVKENLQLKNNLSSVYTEAEMKSFLEMLEIDNKWEQKCGLLSMGQQQRLVIVRSLCQNFEWLILDEPFSHLDKENSQRSLKLINERCNELNAGFVLTTLGDDYDFSYDQELKL
ncbi:MAG: ATP-binding cassette domain-containing protein [Bacteroidota bacterium]